jgi:hypothetical protein
MKKAIQVIICTKTNNFFGTLQGRKATLKRSFFYNGESYFKGIFIKIQMKQFEAPSFFFENI